MKKRKTTVDDVEHALHHPEEGRFPRIDGDGTLHVDQYGKCSTCKGLGWVKPEQLLMKELRDILGEKEDA